MNTCYLNYMGKHKMEIKVQGSSDIKQDLISKITNPKVAGRGVQVVVCLLTK
jgi:hypothetical protein